VRSQLDKRNLSSTRAQDTSVGPCVSMFYSIFMLFVYMCVRMPLSSRSIAGVPSGRVLFSFFSFWESRHAASAPSTAGTHTGGV